MDNQKEFPSEQPLCNTKWNSESLVFTGEVHWGETTVMDSDHSWSLSITFSDDFKKIIGGSLICKSIKGEFKYDFLFANNFELLNK